MVFSSLIFLYVFLPISLLAFFLCKNIQQQNIVLLISSLIFYAWGEPKYVFLLIIMSFFAYICAMQIEKHDDKKQKILWMAVSVITDIVFIAFFKYSSFICSQFGEVPEFIKKIVLPIGISFYTFQLMTYVIDVYRGEEKAQKKFVNVLLYAALFHQCVAGPIVRYGIISKELFDERNAGGEFLLGIKRFTTGLAKKALLANSCGALADSLFIGGNVELESLTVLSTWVGVLAYMLQIYLDFSAYSDMAIGLGRMIGLHYPENFNYPYISKSVTEFWRRWHMTLSGFFRDYVYIPLGGNRCSKGRWLFNLFIVWALTGLWHGASWNFVFWGLYFFVFIVLEKLFLGIFLEKSKVLSHIYLLFVVFCGWILFRFSNIEFAITIFKNLFALNGNVATDFISKTVLSNNIILFVVSSIACTPALKKLGEKINDFSEHHKKIEVIWKTINFSIIPVLLLILSTSALVGDSYNPFIYFQF